MELYINKSLSDLKSEAKTRKLRYGGQKDAIISNLRRADWEAWHADNPTFNRFSEFPLEVQRLVWQQSLPGPRVLAISWSTSPTGKVSVAFPKQHRTPNPTALMVCRISRDIALMKYRLVFGQKYMYGDLAGGDMLYFGPWNLLQPHDFPQLIASNLKGTGSVTLPQVAADLDSVTSIVLHYDCVRNFQRYSTDRSFTLCLRVRLLARFKSLERVSLCCGGTDRLHYHHRQGHVQIEDDVTKFTRDIGASEDTQRRIVEDVAGSFYQHFELPISSGMQDLLLTVPESACRGQPEDLLPKLNLVQANRIYDKNQPKFTFPKCRKPQRITHGNSSYNAMQDPLHPLNQ